MGDIASMAVDGTCCTECGEYISSGPGYPRTCSVCSESLDDEGDDALERLMPRTAASLKNMQADLQAEYDEQSARRVLAPHPSLLAAFLVLPLHNPTGGLTLDEVSRALNVPLPAARERLKRLRTLGLAHSTGNGVRGRRSKDNPDRWSRS